jgi:hypothetical protein
MARYAGERGMSRGLGAARSRKVPLCGPIRDMVVRTHVHCMISPAGRGLATRADTTPTATPPHTPAPQPGCQFCNLDATMSTTL